MKLTWHEEKRLLWSLKDTLNNPRTLTKKAFDKLVKSIKDNGYHERIVVDVDGTILSGHQRKRALVHIHGANNPEITVLAPSYPLSKRQRDEILIRSNISSGDWDYDLLSSHFEVDMLQDFGLSLNISDACIDLDNNVSHTPDSSKPPKQPKEHTCPACGNTFSASK